MSKFREDIACSPLTDSGAFAVDISPDWRIVRGANGGHLAAMVLNAMVSTVGDPERTPRSLTAHFLRVPREEAARIDVRLERSGRTMSTVSARLSQDDKPVVLAVAAFSTERSGPEFADVRMPEIPPPDALEQVTDREDFAFGRQFDYKRALGPAPGDLDDRAELGIWMRLRDHDLTDHVAATQLLDAFAPAVFAKLGQGGGGSGVPTVEMTYHFREPLPVPDARPGAWHLGLFRSRLARAGFVEEDGWLWAEDGRLVAQSRQLALLGGGG